jgi:AcrR family transcriptional regulator
VKPTSRRGDETRARLLNAAREQFAQDGYDGASLRMVAASAQITLALLHYHFGSKRDLYRAVWVEQYSSDEERTRRSVYASISPGDSREQALRRVIEAAITGPVHLLQDKRGTEFITILARELADPKAEERGLLDEFINPVSEDTRHSLRKIMPHLSDERFETGLLMTIAASQQLIRYSTLSAIRVDVGSPDHLLMLVPTMVDFLVAGWVSLEG